MNIIHWTAFLVALIAVSLLLDADLFIFLLPDPPANAFENQGEETYTNTPAH
jgi:hypothetical protein